MRHSVYFNRIGDSFTALAKTFNLPPFFCSRTNVILVLTSTVLFPLCSLKSLSALAPFSLLGLGGTLYTALFMALRLVDKTYAAGSSAVVQAPSVLNFFASSSVSSAGGKYFEDIGKSIR